MRCSLTKCVEMSWLLYKTNRFHFAVGLYSDNAQRTSKRGENISHASTSLFSSRFDVICALSEYKWNLFVKSSCICVHFGHFTDCLHTFLRACLAYVVPCLLSF